MPRLRHFLLQNLVPNCLRIWLVALGISLQLALFGSQASAAQLKSVRIGDHEAFTRIVFELDETVKYSAPAKSGKDGIISLSFPSTQTALPDKKSAKKSGRVRSIEFSQKGSDLEARVRIRFNDFEIATFSLINPSRVIIDVHPLKSPAMTPAVISDKQVASPAAEIQSEKQNRMANTVTPTPVTIPAPLPVMTAKVELSETNNQGRILVKTNQTHPGKSGISDKNASLPASVKRIPSLRVAIAVLVIMILLGAGFLLALKRRPVNSVHAHAAQSVSEPLATGMDRMQAIDRQIKEKLRRMAED